MKSNLFCALIAVLLSQSVFAQSFSGSGIFSRSGDEESVGWTLSGWLAQKQNFRAMDHWLAMNKSAGRFEINIDGGQQRYDYVTNGQKETETINRYSVSAYYSIFGIEYQFEDSSEKFTRESVQVNLRLFGVSSSGTHLTAFYGFRTTEFENPSNELENQFAGARLNLYITSFFGINGEYKKNFSAEDNNQREFEGDRIEYGAFFDIAFIRLFGKGFKEKNSVTDNLGVNTPEERDGFEAGFAFHL